MNVRRAWRSAADGARECPRLPIALLPQHFSMATGFIRYLNVIPDSPPTGHGSCPVPLWHGLTCTTEIRQAPRRGLGTKLPGRRCRQPGKSTRR